MAKVICGGFHLGDNLKMDGETLSIGSDKLAISDNGFEISTGVPGESFSVGFVEDEVGALVNGVRGTDDVYLYAGAGKDVVVGSVLNCKDNLLVDGEIVGYKSIVLQSSTEGSVKNFRITVDDSGTISAEEIV